MTPAKRADASPAALERTRIKLIGPPVRLRAAFAALGGVGEGVRQTAIYYDTGDRRLWSKGYALALRLGSGRAPPHRLLLLRETAIGFRRQVWAGPSAAIAPDPALLPKDAPSGAFADIRADELLPRFRTFTDRAVVHATRNGSRIEAALDACRAVAVGGSVGFRELELRLETGDAGDLLALARALAAEHRLGLTLTSKAARGMALAAGETAPAVKAGWPDLAPEVDRGHAVGQILATATPHVFGNLAIAAAGRDPGGAHQLRVALRRLRSALALFKGGLGPLGDDLNAGARLALRRLGDVRDLDVFLNETAPPVAAAGCGDVLQPLIARAEAARSRAYGDVRAMMADPAFTGFLVDLLTAAEAGGLALADSGGPLKPLAARLLRRRRRKTLRAGDGFALLPNADRHVARIELKKLRYACGYFQSLWPGEATQAYRRLMSALQDDLGRLNDADVAAALVDRLAGRDRAAAIAGATVKGWYAHRLAASEAHMVACWEAFRDARPFWRDQ